MISLHKNMTILSSFYFISKSFDTDDFIYSSRIIDDVTCINKYETFDQYNNFEENNCTKLLKDLTFLRLVINYYKLTTSIKSFVCDLIHHLLSIMKKYLLHIFQKFLTLYFIMYRSTSQQCIEPSRKDSCTMDNDIGTDTHVYLIYYIITFKKSYFLLLLLI